jgi:ubiquinone/menaquinone biosynthesis C-methylase UbiE
MALSERIQREKDFHDQRFANDANRQKKVKNFYRITTTVKQLYQQTLLQQSSTCRFLEYGCGTGSTAFDLARQGAKVAAIDISKTALDKEQEHALQQGLDKQMRFLLMNAESLAVQDNSFDIVYGSGILHHLSLAAGLRELQRVLPPTGTALFIEPMGHNLFINLFRSLTPAIRSRDEHPLLDKDIALMHRYFRQVHVHYFYFLSLVAAPFAMMPGFPAVLRWLESIDQFLFQATWFRKQAWIALIQLSEPIK